MVNRYSVKNPNSLHIKNIFKKYALDFNEKLAFYQFICKWKLHFSDTIVSVKSDTWSSISGGCYLRNFLSSKIEFFVRQGHKFSHLSEINISFISDLRNMTYEHYLQQPKPMLEWGINVILAKNPELIKSLNRSHIPPIIRKYQDLL